MAGQLINRGKNTWLVRVYLGEDPETHKRIYANRTVHGNKKDAEAVLTRMLRERDTGRLTIRVQNLTVGALLDDVIADYRLQGRKSVWWAETLIAAHLRPFFGHLSVSAVDSAVIQRYAETRQRQGKAPATIANELAILRRAFNLGVHTGKIGRAPIIPKPKVQNARQGFLEPEQYRALRDALPDHLKALFVVGYHTGARLGELRELRWDQVDLLNGEIRLTGAQTKTSEPRSLPIYGEMEHFLRLALEKRNQEHPECDLVFHYHGRRIGSHLKGWKKACAAVGLEGLHFHDLRRSTVRAMERAGIPRHVAMRISGHKTEAIYRRYDIVSRQDLAEAGKRLAAYLREKLEAGRTQPHTDSGDSAHYTHTKPKSGIQ